MYKRDPANEVENSKNVELRGRDDSSCIRVHAPYLLEELNALLQVALRQATLTTPTPVATAATTLTQTRRNSNPQPPTRQPTLPTLTTPTPVARTAVATAATTVTQTRQNSNPQPPTAQPTLTPAARTSLTCPRGHSGDAVYAFQYKGENFKRYRCRPCCYSWI